MDDQFRVLYWLIIRNIIVLKKVLRAHFFDAMLILFLHLFLFIKIFPLFGIDFDFVPPLFLGEMFLMFLFLQGGSYCMKIASDIEGSTIDYHLILPISKHLLLFSYGISYMLESIVMTLPLAVLGIYVLSFFSANVSLTWLPFLGYYFLTVAFNALLFLSFAFRYSMSWLQANLWARRIVPMFCIGASNVPWKYITQKIPVMSYITLCNPSTYIAEGLRATMLVGDFLPVSMCIGALLIFSIISYITLIFGIKTKLDAV